MENADDIIKRAQDRWAAKHGRERAPEPQPQPQDWIEQIEAFAMESQPTSPLDVVKLCRYIYRLETANRKLVADHNALVKRFNTLLDTGKDPGAASAFPPAAHP